MEREVAWAEERGDIGHTFPEHHRVNKSEKTQKYLQIPELRSDRKTDAATYASLETGGGGGGGRGDEKREEEREEGETERRGHEKNKGEERERRKRKRHKDKGREGRGYERNKGEEKRMRELREEEIRRIGKG